MTENFEKLNETNHSMLFRTKRRSNFRRLNVLAATSCFMLHEKTIPAEVLWTRAPPAAVLTGEQTCAS